MPDPTPPPDREWIQSVVQCYERRLIAYATRHTAGDVERARDVVQDTFLRLWQADRSRIEGHLARWLYTVCRKRAVDVRRKERRMRRLETEVEHSPPRKAAVDGPDTGGRDTDALLHLLTDRQQEVVRLKFQGGLSYREIAEVMNTTVTNVGVMLHKAIKKIRRSIDDGQSAPVSGVTR